MNKVVLLQDSEIGVINEKQTKKIEDNPISKYNYVIANYNTEYSLVDDIKLQLIKESPIYSKLFSLMKNPLAAFLIFLILLFVPFINIILYLLILVASAYYFSGLSFYNMNLTRNPDPFRNMIFSEEICESIKNINWRFDIEVSRIFSFNTLYKFPLIILQNWMDFL